MTDVTATPNDPSARGYWTMSRGDGQRAFRAARRHSIMVRVLRVALPAAVVLITLAVVLVTYFNPLRMLAKLPIDVGNLVISGTKITMEQPRMAGFTRDARAYELSADAAAQDLTKPDIIELNKIHATIEMQDKSSVEMTALTGLYDSKGETLKLDQDILLTSSTGYEGRLSEASIDIRTGHVVSKHPVQLKLLQGTLDAKGLEIVNSGDLIRFDGGVKMILMLNQPAKDEPDNAPPPAPGAPKP
jgi:lipopolysaccharide export system protein LptC